MNIREYLTKQQPLLLRQFSSALQSGHLSHAYLLSGEAGTPLFSIAMFLAKSIVCEHPNPLADETCWHCLRIDDGNYADIIVYDGSSATIKKDDIQTLESSFEKTPVERAGKLIYVLHLVENMTPEAINSLLKFLEEPHQEVYAFLTSENEEKVLPTIISRSQKLRVLPANRQLIIDEATAAGVSSLDAELLSFFHHDPALMLTIVSEDYYQGITKTLALVFEQLASSYYQARFLIEHELTERYYQKEHIRFLIDVLILIVSDLALLKNGGAPTLASYGKILKPLTNRFQNLEAILHQIMLLRGQIELNVNPALLIEHVFAVLLKEFVHES
ncbi:MAG TPA: hypothetical protein PK340_03885 [Bacilli bacterium]|nr:hypothetical protein [Bacilli bacterium]